MYNKFRFTYISEFDSNSHIKIKGDIDELMYRLKRGATDKQTIFYSPCYLSISLQFLK
jgi:hypothetical protein